MNNTVLAHELTVALRNVWKMQKEQLSVSPVTHKTSILKHYQKEHTWNNHLCNTTSNLH
jgi:hypothetical protein